MTETDKIDRTDQDNVLIDNRIPLLKESLVLNGGISFWLTPKII